VRFFSLFLLSASSSFDDPLSYTDSSLFCFQRVIVTFEEFKEGSKKDPTIVQALSLYDGLV